MDHEASFETDEAELVVGAARSEAGGINVMVKW